MPGPVMKPASEVMAAVLIIRGKCAENWAGVSSTYWGGMTIELEREA